MKVEKLKKYSASPIGLPASSTSMANTRGGVPNRARANISGVPVARCSIFS